MGYTGAPVTVSFDGFLFDMDGTIVDSTPAVEKHWAVVSKEIGVPVETILKTSHGRRSMDTLKLIAPEKANWEYVLDMESQLPKLYGQEAVEIPGARSLIGSLVTAGAPWAIVTSGTEPLVRGWISVISLPEPHALVTAESVQEGKPDPACFLKGREQLGLKDSAKNILVLEDSPAGIKAGKAAGCKVVGLVTSHTVEQVVAAGPDWVVKDLDSVKVLESKDGVTTLQFADTWTA